MTVFSVRLVVLACLCAAIPLARPVEGAHLHVSRSMEKHATSPHPPHGTHTPSSFDGSTPVHKHIDERDDLREHENKHKDGDGHNDHREHENKHKDGDGHNDHREHEDKHERRLARPPPLLRHYREHNHNAIHYQSQDAHDRAGDKAPRSAFARSRYRRERTSRSSVYVPGEHGSTYVVSGTSHGRGGPRQASADKRPSHAHQTRQAPGNNNPASGRIDIMSAAQSPGSTQRLASLAVDSTPIDWTSGHTSVEAFQLNASTTNRTQFVMVPTDDSDAGGKYVRLATPVFDAGSAATVMYCATYNANPGTPSALLMTPCADGLASSDDNAIVPCADDEDDASSSKSQQSQIFSYDPFSGAIEPILSTEGSSSGNSSSDISASCAGAKLRRGTSNSTTSSSATPSSTNTAASPNVSQHAQNVTLVYVAGALEVPAPSSSASANSTMGSTTATPSAHMKQDAVVTTTVTTTVVTTVMASGTVSPAMAEVSVPTSSPATSTPRSSLSSASPTSSGTATATPANAEGSLEVEVVGLAPSTSTPAPTITTFSASTLSTSSSQSTTSTRPNAEAVASLVVEQMHHRSVVAIAGASVV